MQLNESLYTHTAYRGHCRLQHASNIQSTFYSQDTHTRRQSHTHFCLPLSRKRQYSSSSPLCRLLSLCSLLLVKENCLSKLLEDIVNHFSKTLSFVILFHMVCKLMQGGGGVVEGRDGGRWPLDHQSRQSSRAVTSRRPLTFFWLTWLMCFWSVVGEGVKLPFWQGADRSHITAWGSAGIHCILYITVCVERLQQPGVTQWNTKGMSSQWGDRLIWISWLQPPQQVWLLTWRCTVHESCMKVARNAVQWCLSLIGLWILLISDMLCCVSPCLNDVVPPSNRAVILMWLYHLLLSVCCCGWQWVKTEPVVARFPHLSHNIRFSLSNT